MVTCITPTRWYYYLFPWFGREEWAFDLGGSEFRVENIWFGPARLLHGETLLDENKRHFAIRGRKPFLEAQVKVDDAAPRTVAVYLRAIWATKIRVEVNGHEISKGFV